MIRQLGAAWGTRHMLIVGTRGTAERERQAEAWTGYGAERSCLKGSNPTNHVIVGRGVRGKLHLLVMNPQPQVAIQLHVKCPRYEKKR